MLIRLVLIILVIWGLIVVVRKLKLLAQARQEQLKQQDHAVTHKQMVQCAYCHIYLPKDDALSKHDNYFCCSDHMSKVNKPDK